ncbi:hypothetical protein [Pandoraea terrae]|nr:hypothetical protein [Pandoraea terrae]
MISFAKKFSLSPLAACIVFALAAVPAAPAFAQGQTAAESMGRLPHQIEAPKAPYDATADRVAPASAAAPNASDAIPPVDDNLNLHPEASDFDGRRALLDRQRAWAEYRFSEAEYECASKFFVTSCVESAREKRREELKAIRSQRLVLDDDVRRARAEERETRLAEKKAQEAAEATQKEAERRANVESYQNKQAEYQQRVTERTGHAPERAANAAAHDAKQAERQQKLQEAQKSAAQKAAEREENVRKYQQKQQEAIERQQKSDERKAKAAEGDNSPRNALPGK